MPPRADWRWLLGELIAIWVVRRTKAVYCGDLASIMMAGNELATIELRIGVTEAAVWAVLKSNHDNALMPVCNGH